MELPQGELFRDDNSSTYLPPQTKEHIHKFFNRLEDYDRSLNSENVCNPLESQMVLPQDEMFRAVNSSTYLPPLTKEHIHKFFNRFNKKTNDAYDLNESRYLLVMRYCTTGEYTFLKGTCKATMKNVQFEVNIRLQNDGSIDEASCECAVGNGKEAHCKHVAIVLFGVEEVKRIGEECTQDIHHKPKQIFMNAPLKAERLPSKRHLSNIIFHPFPLSHINIKSYNDRVRNICIGAVTSNMPIKQRYAAANAVGILNDHQYAQSDAKFVLCQNLKSDVEQIINIENGTRN